MQNHFFSLCLKNSDMQKRTREDCENYMREKLSKKAELADLLIPDFGVGCRRYVWLCARLGLLVY